MAARVTRPAVWREYMLVCKWELGISFYDVISYFTLLSMTFLAWHQHNNSRVDRFMAVSQKKKTVRQPVRHITGSDKFFSQKEEEENVCVSFNHRIPAWSWFMSHSVDVMRIRRKKNDRYWQMFFFFAYRSSEEEEKTVNDKRNKIFGNVSLTCDDGDDVTWIPDGASAAPRDWTLTSSDLRSKHQRSPQRSRTEQLLPQQRRPGQFKFSFLLKTRKPASHWFTDCFFPTTTHALLECFFRRTDTRKRFSCKE